MFAILIFIIFIAAEILICSTPARIPMLQRRAQTSRVWHWSAILLLALIPTFVNYVALVWLTARLDIIIASALTDPCWNVEGECNLDYELQDELGNEIALRRLLFSREGQCFSDNLTVCEAATNWQQILQERQAYEANYNSRSDYLGYILGILIFLTPTILTGYAVHRITHDNRKQKRG